MATISITVPDSVVPRIRTAFGHQEGSPPVWVDATVVEVQDNIKVYVKAQVINHESTIAGMIKRNEVSNEPW